MKRAMLALIPLILATCSTPVPAQKNPPPRYSPPPAMPRYNPPPVYTTPSFRIQKPPQPARPTMQQVAPPAPVQPSATTDPVPWWLLWTLLFQQPGKPTASSQAAPASR